MYFVYILKSHKDDKLYIGSTSGLKRRLASHNNSRVQSTKHRLPFDLLCYECYKSKNIAQNRERYLKSSDGHKDIKKRGI